MDEITTLNDIAVDLTVWATPLFTACMVFIIVLLLKDLATGIARGLKFKLNSTFHEGDNVRLDSENATIVKIGLFTTVFGIYSGDDYCWRYVPNERIPFLKLEKIIHNHVTVEEDRFDRRAGDK